jgi:hypothetical protein
VLGVSHKLQGLPNFRESVSDGDYTERVIGIISDESIDFSFEDASGCERTSAGRLMGSLKSIRYLDIDPRLVLTREFAVVVEAGQPLAIDVGDAERVAQQD